MYQQDELARKQVLDLAQSFIVQAPAGSGKTELLIQRYLALLNQVHMPEEIIAITFTRKAAGEMRERILQALHMAAANVAEQSQPLTLQLAMAVIEQDKRQQWYLQQNPNRLRILTIDALCLGICSYTPFLSQFGAQPQVTEDPQSLYQAAVQKLINTIDDHPKRQKALSVLLLHVDNRAYQLEELLINILGNRDQWLPHIMAHRHQPEKLRSLLEEALHHIAIEKMQTAKQCIPTHLEKEILYLAQHAGHYFAHEANHVLAKLATMTELSANHVSFLPIWQALAHLFLTQENQWRNHITKAQGFIAKTDIKLRMENFLAEQIHHEALRQALTDCRQCPPIHYDDAQWQVIAAIVELLPILTAELYLVFQEKAVVDFIEISLAALRALGEPDAPTDLALYFEHKIQHILVDEFQDTSIMQFHLLERLTSEWQANDKRTLFLVGDPMQSIYRFRNAEVGLFLRAKEQGIGNMRLTFLKLSRNFRSDEAAVTWFNSTFHSIFPKNADIGLGAIPYTSALAVRPDSSLSGVHFYTSMANGTTEQEKIITIIREHQARDPKARIAILVRSRTHLQRIVPALQQAQITYSAIDIAPLRYCLEISDLLALTKALCHLGDTVSWLAILRAPWCGLTLHDLHAVRHFSPKGVVYNALQEHEKIYTLSSEGKKILLRVAPILVAAWQERGQKPLAQWIKGTWLALGGPATLNSLLELENCEQYFALLRELVLETDFSLAQLERRLNDLYAKTTSVSSENLQIMTIHKAKGLEFDHVILPGLHRKNPQDSAKIMLWQERPSALGFNDLLLAPIKSSAQKHDLMYQYLRQIESQKLELESCRLLYVAATRAKKSLHLLADFMPEENSLATQISYKPPHKGTFLEKLYSQFQPLLTSKTPALSTEGKNITPNTTLYRLPPDWRLPLNDPLKTFIISENQTVPDLTIDNEKKELIIGRIVHEEFEQIAHLGAENITPSWVAQRQQRWQARLCPLLNKQEMINAINRIQSAIHHMLGDERGRWILSKEHTDIHNEYEISVVLNHRVEKFIIDRCFIDKENIRWIIDYKTSTPLGLSTREFLAQEHQKYAEQLQRYAYALSQMRPETIKLGLYFPIAKLWYEWSY